jgi:hypothetical protein
MKLGRNLSPHRRWFGRRKTEAYEHYYRPHFHLGDFLWRPCRRFLAWLTWSIRRNRLDRDWYESHHFIDDIDGLPNSRTSGHSSGLVVPWGLVSMVLCFAAAVLFALCVGRGASDADSDRVAPTVEAAWAAK